MICKIIQAKYCPNLTELMLIAQILEIEDLRSNFNNFPMRGGGRLQMERLISYNCLQDLRKLNGRITGR